MMKTKKQMHLDSTGITPGKENKRDKTVHEEDDE